ncbi:hypothetical protein DAPPUDRAFT_115788 [Daphnia pulex]|uniref:Phospholipase A2-like domain-containing protein n=1 Tax=Daphnia pulex TaxID=6669 RepID=E9HMJ1_DAPPU|nr:hypothetical protein DAPPUDRAFT_115788 [Daphnia pulex]|eukprot:EFX67030.1 hypothetical protein DAPPUDRAFT_115788 [Daphnia pulex]
MWRGNDNTDLIRKNAPYFTYPDGKYFPSSIRLKEAMIAFFGQKTEFVLDWNKNSESTYRSFDTYYTPSDVKWFWTYLKSKYGDAVKNAPTGTAFSKWVKELHEKQDRERRAPIPERFKDPGYSLPGYNFCGPKNSMDYVPTTMLDSLCQYHDLIYGYRPNSLERDDDKEFTTMLNLWAQANAGDGWTGPTYYEKQHVIPFIKGVFAAKDAVGSESPWTKAIIPSILKNYVTNFKKAITDPQGGSDFSQLARAKDNPLVSIDNMYDHAFIETNDKRDPTRNRQYAALNDALDDLEDVKKWWNRQSILHPDAQRPGYRIPEILWSWSEDPSKLMWSNLAMDTVPYAVHKSYESRSHIFDGVDWEPIHAVWSTLDDPSRQNVDIPGQRQIYKTYDSLEAADKAAKELIAKQQLEEGKTGEKRTRTDDTEEEYEEKKPRLDYVENVDPDEVTRQPDEDVIRPASPDTARRVGEEALAGAREIGRSKEVKEEVVLTEIQPDGTVEQVVEQVPTQEEMPNKNTTESGQLVGGVTMNLGPPRSLISLKRQHFTCDVIIRDFHLLDYALGSTIFEGEWVDRTPLNYSSAGISSKICLDRFTKAKRVAAQCLPLDIPSMCLDHKARYDLANMPWNKIKFMGGNIAIHGMRHKENQTINQSRLAYTDGGPGMNNIDRKIMWKMYDRERDYNWIYEANPATGTPITDFKAAVSRDTVALTNVDLLTEKAEERRKIRLGQAITAWNKDGLKKFLPQLIKLTTDQGDHGIGSVNGDRLYESMNDHALAEGPLEFPMMGWPYYVRNPTRDLAFNDLYTPKTAGYLAEEVADISFVGLNYPTMKEVWERNREIRASKISGVDPWTATSKFGLTHSAPYKHSVTTPSKADPHTSSHCAMIHVPSLPLYDGKSNYSAIACDLVVRGTFEMDFTCPKDVQKQTSPGALGEIWDDCVDSSICPFGGYGLENFSMSRVQWVSGVGQYIEAKMLINAEKSTYTVGKETKIKWTPAIEKVYGVKDQGSLLTVSGSDA